MFFFFYAKPYIVLSCECYHRKAPKDRLAAVPSLSNFLKSLNERFASSISSPFQAVASSFQGIIDDGKDLLPIILTIQNALAPDGVRIGIGIGHLNEKDSTIGSAMDFSNDAYHYLVENSKKKQTPLSDVYVIAGSDYEKKLAPVNTIFSLLATIESSWTTRQRQIIWELLSHKDKQTEIAHRLGITQSTVQKSLHAGNYYTYENALLTLQHIFEEIGEHANESERSFFHGEGDIYDT